MEKKLPSLAVLGSFPPPYGGVTIHTRRLCSLLEKNGVDFIVYNAASDTENGKKVVSVYRRRHLWMLWYAFFGKEPVVYIMSPRLMSWMLGAFMASVRGKKVILRIQNSMVIDVCKKSSLQRFLASFCLRRINTIVSVNREVYDHLLSLGVNPDRAHVFPGFLPPVPSDFHGQKIAPNIRKFMAGHRPLIAANGKIAFYRGEDLYGLDHLVELVIQLKPEFPNIGVIFSFTEFSNNDQKYLDKLVSKAKKHGVENNILFDINGNGPFLPILTEADIFVRPTNTDGDANSIREAIHLKIPTVASDVVQRPEGVYLFRTRDIGQFVEKTRSILLMEKIESTRFDRETNSIVQNYINLLIGLCKETT